jgi:hypothetical protein
MKRFFYASAAVLMLAIGCQFGAKLARAQASSTSTIAQAGEVAVLTGVLPSGATIPLPTYSDGTQALESECHWLVSINTASFGGASAAASLEKCFTQGRVITAYWCTQGNCGGGGDPWFATANYMIIAVRSGAPTPARAGTWGELKARYR